MPSKWVEACRARERAVMAARKRKQEEPCDKELDACVIAYHAHRVDGGQMKWEAFRREWYMTSGGKHVG